MDAHKMFNPENAIEDLGFSYCRVFERPTQTCYYFKNGYGASVITHGNGLHEGLYEMALLKGDSLDCHYIENTSFEDVRSFLSNSEVWGYLKEIASFEEVKS